jgi:DNA-binding NarL/FixJ family response regulator
MHMSASAMSGEGRRLRDTGATGWPGASGRAQPSPDESLMAAMVSVAAMLEATARMQREIAAVLHDLAARTGHEATVQRLRRAYAPAHYLVPLPTGRPALHSAADQRPEGQRPEGQRPAGPAQPRPLPDPLTPREEVVLQLLTTRLSLREISQELYVSLNTIKSHTRAIYRKLDASTRHEAVQRGRDLTILPG